MKKVRPTFRQRATLNEQEDPLDLSAEEDLDLPEPRQLQQPKSEQAPDQDVHGKVERVLRGLDYIEAADGLLAMAAAHFERELNAVDLAGKEGAIEEIQNDLAGIRRSILRRLNKMSGGSGEKAEDVTRAIDQWRARKIQASAGAVAGRFNVAQEALQRMGFTRTQQKQLLETLDELVESATTSAGVGPVAGYNTTPMRAAGWGDAQFVKDLKQAEAKKKKKKKKGK